MLNVLFVDDEPNILKGYKRIFIGKRKSWNIHFADSGTAALKILENTPMDIIITDMRMPGMDGAQLLNTIRLKYPHIIRIILSGQSDENKIMNSVQSTHQFLAKPCNAATIERAVEQSVSFREKIGNENIQKIISRIDRLPSLPELYLEIEELLKKENFSLNTLSAIIEKDIAMTASILKLVNSAFFGIPRKVSSMHEAVSYLGVTLIKTLVLNHSLFSVNASDDLSPQFIKQLWEHSNETARFALCIAQNCFTEQAVIDEITLAASVHDIGMLILANNLPDTFRELLRQSSASTRPLPEIEQQIMQATHAGIGAYLANLWSFPPVVVELILGHHDATINYKPLYVLHLADVNAQQRLNHNFGFPLEPLDDNSMKRFDTADSSIKEIVTDCHSKGSM